MTGDLKINGYKVLHTGDYGHGNGINADLLDGQHGSFYQDASNLNAGTVPTGRLSGTYNISISGNAATATKLATARTISLTGNASGSASFDGSGNISINTSVSYASNADTVDGKHASSFVQKAGDTMTGNLTLQGTSINIQRPETSGGYARGMMFYSKDGSTVEAGIGMLGSGNNPPQALYMGFGESPWNSSAGLTVTPTNITFKNNKVWHAGNDGSGSGLDADLLDGQHGSFYRNASNLNAGTVPTGRLSGTYNISVSGNAATATKLATARLISLAGDASGSASFDGSGNVSINTTVSHATNADKLGGYTQADFVKKAGDTMTGPLTVDKYAKISAPTGLVTGNDISMMTIQGTTWVDVRGVDTKGLKVRMSTDSGSTWTDILTAYSDALKYKGDKIWHSGNDGSGSGLDADLLDGKDSTFFTNAANLSSGIVPVARLSGTYNISVSGNAATATKLATARTISLTGNATGSASFDGSGNISINTTVSQAANANTLGGYAHTAFVKKAGDTMTGDLAISKNKAWLTLDSPSSGANDNEQAAGISIGEAGKFGGAALHLTYTGDGYGHIGMGTVSTAYPQYEAMTLYYLDNVVRFNNTPTVSGNKVWHAGNDGSGSGLDADLLDGKNWEDIKNYIDSGSTGYQPNGRTVFISSGTWTKKSDTKFVMVYVWGGGGGGGGRCLWSIPVTGGNGGTSSFGSYCSATGGKGGSATAGGAGGTGSGGDVNLSGKTGGAPSGKNGGAGGRPGRENGFSSGVGGHGTYEADHICLPAYGGGGGGYAEKWIDVRSISSVYVTVGAGGAGAVVEGFPPAGSGRPGFVIVEEYK